MTTMLLWIVAAYLAVGVITLLVPSVRCQLDSYLPTAFSERMLAATEGKPEPQKLKVRLILLRSFAYLISIILWPLALLELASTERKPIKEIDISRLVAPYLEYVKSLTNDCIRNKIKRWDLNDKLLMSYIGYVAGVIEAAAYPYGVRPDDDLVEDVLNRYIADNLSDWLSGVRDYLDTVTISKRIESSGSTIGGFQSFDGFIEGQMHGGQDYLKISAGLPGAAPIGLFELGLIR